MLVAMTSDLLLPPGSIAQTALPDLTQPQYLNQLADRLPLALAVFALLAIGLGAGMALFNFSLRNYPSNVAIGDWVMQSAQLMRGLQQIFLVTAIVLLGFGLCSTLSNRQSNWEQARVAQKTPTLEAGELIQQSSPQVSYITQEPFSYTTQLDGKLVKVQDKREVTRQSSVSGSNLQVTISPLKITPSNSNNFAIDFRGDYQITNPIGTTNRFVFQIAPPTGYSLLQNFEVQRDGKKLTSTTPGEYRFPIQIAPGSISKLRVNYRAQGSPQWVYSAKAGSLDNFRMTISSTVPRLNFVSDVAPTKTTSNGDRQTFTWAFDRDASVQKPFGVSIGAPVAAQTGTLPLLLLLAPGIFGWWMLLLCLSIPMRLQDIAIAGLAFFTGMFALTYFSRIGDFVSVWSGVSIVLLLLVWGLGRGNLRIAVAAIISTLVGAILPIYSFSIAEATSDSGTRGMVLSAIALLSVFWLVARNWYDWYRLEPRERPLPDRSNPEPEAIFTRHDLLEESAKYNQLNPGAPTPEEIERRRLRDDGVTGSERG
ncbi:hypothetical protein [Chamaesiphon polymorphus]|uniref:Uncharacterized protein n=1 Tax=Chamaesiphon polymorphus CCALA 037 TaxID=2107692 RepID=A0A2T1GJ53_9CYAN|nr:hypothetical protein [Chamaesiphon polymorphus]PSB57702.1 hypothetical protein C7B77_07400 [Chamaesiphon polymorphus CCALA 037]